MKKVPFDSETAKLFADNSRVRILEFLSTGEMTNSQLARKLGLSKGTVSHHLKILEDAGIVHVARTQAETHGIPMKFYSLKVELIPLKKVETWKYARLKKELKRRLRDAFTEKHAKEVNITLLRAIKSVIQTAEIDADGVLFNIGEELGKEVFSERIEGDILKDILEEVARIWEELDLGRIKLAMDSTCVKIRVFECFDCGGTPNIGRTFCFFDTGIITGILNTKLNGNYSVKEVKCSGTGYEYCEFEIKKL